MGRYFRGVKKRYKKAATTNEFFTKEKPEIRKNVLPDNYIFFF